MLLILCLIFALGQAIFFDEELSDEQLLKIEDKLLAQKVRCTRRFTPGACLDPVESVWTFDFQILNCTERLGCASSYRTNRFGSYRKCMHRCQVIIDLYMQIITYDGKNDSNIAREGKDVEGRRDGSDYITSSPSTVEEYDEYIGDEAIHAKFVYGDPEMHDDML